LPTGRDAGMMALSGLGSGRVRAGIGLRIGQSWAGSVRVGRHLRDDDMHSVCLLHPQIKPKPRNDAPRKKKEKRGWLGAGLDRRGRTERERNGVSYIPFRAPLRRRSSRAVSPATRARARHRGRAVQSAYNTSTIN
jgi:hypothetical protein